MSIKVFHAKQPPLRFHDFWTTVYKVKHYIMVLVCTKIKSMVKHIIVQGTNKSRSVSKMSEVKGLHFSSSRNRFTKRTSFPQIMIRTILFIGMCKEGNSVGFIFHFQIHTRSKIFFENMVLSNPPPLRNGDFSLKGGVA